MGYLKSLYLAFELLTFHHMISIFGRTRQAQDSATEYHRWSLVAGMLGLSLFYVSGQDHHDGIFWGSGLQPHFVVQIKRGVFYTRSLTRPSLVSEKPYLQTLATIIPDEPIERQRIPFAAVAADIFSGQEIVLDQGSLRQAVAASAAIPGLMPAIELHGRTLVDGSWLDNVPVTPAIAMGAHFMVAVDASWEISCLWTTPESAVEIAVRSNEITRITLNRERRAFADVLLIPEVGEIRWSDFHVVDQCTQAGRRTLRDNLSRIRRRKNLRRLITLGGWMHPARFGAWRRPLVFGSQALREAPLECGKVTTLYRS